MTERAGKWCGEVKSVRLLHRGDGGEAVVEEEEDAQGNKIGEARGQITQQIASRIELLEHFELTDFGWDLCEPTSGQFKFGQVQKLSASNSIN